MLKFRSVSLEDRDLVNKYMYKYGEKSCQHSFAAMYCNKVKYNDMVCEKDGYLYILREKLCNDNERYYLFPMGDLLDEKSIVNAINNIIDDAHSYNKKVHFETLTKKTKDLLFKLFNDKFVATEKRDYFEYIYNYEKLTNQSGSKLSKRRSDLRRLYRDYGEDLVVLHITQDKINDIRAFQKKWLEERLKLEYDEALIREDKVIDVGLSNYEKLKFDGIAVYIKDKIVGYAYGSYLSEDTYDVMIEKADNNLRNISNLLNRDYVRLCCTGGKYVNREEDVGDLGLRKAKTLYDPEILLEKYVVVEV